MTIIDFLRSLRLGTPTTATLRQKRNLKIDDNLLPAIALLGDTHNRNIEKNHDRKIDDNLIPAIALLGDTAHRCLRKHAIAKSTIVYFLCTPSFENPTNTVTTDTTDHHHHPSLSRSLSPSPPPTHITHKKKTNGLDHCDVSVSGASPAVRTRR